MGSARRPVRIVAFAALVSTLGSTAANIAIAVFIYAKTGSAVWLSVSLLLTFGVTGFVTPFTGIIADRFDRRRLIVATELAAGAIYVAMVFVESPAAIVALGFVEALIAMPSGSALRAAVPSLARPEDLTWANGVLSVGFNLGDAVGPLIGGALAASVGVDVVFLVNAATFAVSAALVSSVRARFSAVGADEEDERDILGGFRLIRRDRVLVGIALAWMVGYFAVDVILVADLPYAEAFGVGAIGYSLMNTVWSVAAIGGSWLSRWLRPRHLFAALVAGGLSAFIGLGIGGVAPTFVVLLVGLAVTSLVDAISVVAGDSVIQLRTPDRLRGRTFAAIRGLGWVANAIAFSIAGFLVERLGPRGVYGIGAIAGLIYGAILFFSLRGVDLEAEPVGPSVGRSAQRPPERSRTDQGGAVEGLIEQPP
jgi:MFS family permease